MIRTTSFEEVSIAVATVAQVATMGRVAGNLIVAVTGAAGTLVVVAGTLVVVVAAAVVVVAAAAVAAAVDTGSIVVVQHHSALSVSGMVWNDGVDADYFGFFVQGPVL